MYALFLLFHVLTNYDLPVVSREWFGWVSGNARSTSNTAQVSADRLTQASQAAMLRQGET